MSAIAFNTFVLQAVAASPAADNPSGVFEDMGRMMLYGAAIALAFAVCAAWLMIKLRSRADANARTTSINPASHARNNPL